MGSENQPRHIIVVAVLGLQVSCVGYSRDKRCSTNS
jgi:hypothetical protein